MIGTLYKAYETRLAREVRRGPMPAHTAIILDGNRRHGERKGLTDPTAIYALGVGKLDDVLDWCAACEIPTVTLWVLSTDKPPARTGFGHSGRDRSENARARQ